MQSFVAKIRHVIISNFSYMMLLRLCVLFLILHTEFEFNTCYNLSFIPV